MEECEHEFEQAILPSMIARNLLAFQNATKGALYSCYQKALKYGNNKDYITQRYHTDVEHYPEQSGVTAPITEGQDPKPAAKNTAIACCALCSAMSKS